MTTDWTTRPRESPFQSSNEPENSDAPTALPVDIVIGIDFGTRFTKVAVGDGRQRYVWIAESGDKLIPSIIFVAPDGKVISYPHRPGAGSEKVEYLKMLLVDTSDRVFRSTRLSVSGRPLEDVIRPLAAAFLGSLIRCVMASVAQRRPDLAERRVNWFVNVGVPVQHYDANVDAFREVAAIAYQWSKHDLRGYKLEQLASAYNQSVPRIDVQTSPAQVIPELTGAIHELMRDPNRADALYGLIDIGGGTLDAAIFHINRSGVGRPLRIHAARVDQVGTIAVGRMVVAEIYSKLADYLEGAIVSRHEMPSIQLPLANPLSFRSGMSVESLVQNVVGGVIQIARRHLHGHMFSPRIDATDRDTPPLRVFMSGGGASSAWYKSSIEGTFTTKNMHQFGLTGIRGEIISKPSDYDGDDFPRFVIALGLADSVVAMADAQLPSQFRDAEPPLERNPPSTPITKDMV